MKTLLIKDSSLGLASGHLASERLQAAAGQADDAGRQRRGRRTGAGDWPAGYRQRAARRQVRCPRGCAAGAARSAGGTGAG